MAGPTGHLRSFLSMRAVASQVFILQATVAALLVVAAVVALMQQSRADSAREARTRSLAVAETFAHSPGIVDSLKAPNPTAILQPRAEAARRGSRVDFIVVMTKKGIRWTHPNQDQIGKKYVGTIGPATRGKVVTETFTGTLGPSIRTVVPITDSKGQAVGLVAAGITIEHVSSLAERQPPLIFAAATLALALATIGSALISRRLRHQTHGLGPAQMTRMYEHHDAVLHAVREGVLIFGGDRRLLLANDEARRLLDLPVDAEGRTALELGIAPDMARLLDRGDQVNDEVHLVGDRLLAVNQRPTNREGGPPGTVTTLRNTTELRALTGRADIVQGRLELLYDAGVQIGTTLNVERTCQELASFAVPRFADFVTVDLPDAVLRGDEPGDTRAALRRVASAGIDEETPLYPAGKLIHFAPSTPQASAFETGKAVIDKDLSAFTGWQKQELERARRLVEYGIHSVIAAPLRARGVILGVVTFWRSQPPDPYEPEDVSLAEELVARAAVSIDNARRYTREHTMAVALQRSMLPHLLPEQTGLEVAHRYLPTKAGPAGVGGDWFDVIPLPGARVAIVVGDVVGHGLHAAATMGRLRTAVHNFATLDLPPEELLWHVDEFVSRIDQDEDTETGIAAITGATCLYAIYDPMSGICTIARAGHPEPAVVHPDGQVEFTETPAGPPLGLGELPFESTEIWLPEGSSLVLYTDGLIEDRNRSIDEGLELLRHALTSRPGRPPEETCTEVLDALLPDQPHDDIALIVARTRMIRNDHTADWDIPADPSAVATLRAEVTRTLARWGLAEEALTTELILSELVTNAIRYAAAPIHVRVIRDRALICEVSDGSSTAPHLRRATTTDEGGRGLFLVAQFAERWGTRYTNAGKVIWTEQPLL
ncbi:SpoIIE family protein phosphatase [Streptomyces lavendulocolor]|uniref:SpoIIE family protein phosphatase n=1 Tax=Streptomyces lavendulocolor TaxID=67316 RepID=UPI0033CCC5AA